MMKFVKKVLIVDDNHSILNLLSTVLSCHGYKITVAHNGESAIEAVNQNIFDVIITDINMLGKCGNALLAHSKAIGCSAPFVALTANTDEACALFDLVIAKPLSPKKLIQKLDRLLFQN